MLKFVLWKPSKKINQSVVATKNLLVNSSNILQQKIPLILPPLIDDKFVTDIQARANIFNQVFADQCTPLKNNKTPSTNPLFITQARPGSLDFNEGNILKIIRALNINKAHGHDDISIRMIKICDETLTKPSFIFFRNSLKNYLITQTFGKIIILLLPIKRMTSN